MEIILKSPNSVWLFDAIYPGGYEVLLNPDKDITRKLQTHICFLFIYLFIYDSHTEREAETQAETQAEGEAGSMHLEPDEGFDHGSPGWRPGPKAGAKSLRHPGIPKPIFLRSIYEKNLQQNLIKPNLAY